MGNPNGAIQAISTAAATTFGLGVAFLGFWAYGSHSGQVAWSCRHLWVIVPALFGFSALAFTPFIATRPKDEEKALSIARRCYGCGVSFLLLAIFASFVI
jgi:hypothetical protein